jgi:hypothetical protein
LSASAGLCNQEHLESLIVASQTADNITADQPPSTLIDILERNGGLAVELLVDGKPYDGSLNDLQFDTAVTQDTEVVRNISITATGQEALELYDANSLIARLFATEPEYAQAYKKILAACAEPGGKTLAQLEALLKDEPALQRNSTNGAKELYINYLVDQLERVSAIVWQQGWQTTATGKEVVD